MKVSVIAVLVLSACIVTSIPGVAQAPRLINFQAQVEGITAGTASVVFSVYDNSAGSGAPLWTESYPSLVVSDGSIQALLGTNTPISPNVFGTDGDRFLLVSINNQAQLPLYRLTSVAYALRAAVADSVAGGGAIVGGVTSLNALSGDVSLLAGDGVIVSNAGQAIQVSLDTTQVVTSLNGLDGPIVLEGSSSVGITANGRTLQFTASGGGGGGGISSLAAGTGIDVANASGPIATVSLAADAITDAHVANNSLTAISLATNSVGSDEIAAGAVGSSELTPSITLTPGGRLQIANPGGNVRVELTTLNNAGFIGLNAANNADAITLDNPSSGGGRVTVHGASGGSRAVLDTRVDEAGRLILYNRDGVNGVRGNGNIDGTDDRTTDPFAGGSLAVYKLGGDETSVWMRTNGTNDANSWGVLGLRDAADNETIFLNAKNGDVSIAGNLSKGSGSFKIDHPLDPTNKYLSHSFVESPDMMNVYNGNIVLDANGEAWIEMPEWFGALNRDFRYQLTCIGGQAMVFIAEEVAENRFKIAGGYEGLKVSWQLTGVRQDAYAEKHRIQVETEKPSGERGTYLHPDAFGAARQQ